MTKSDVWGGTKTSRASGWFTMMAAAVLIAAGTGSAWAVPTGGGSNYTQIRNGNERPLSEILADTGLNLTRISDDYDAFWEKAPNSPTAVARARARYAGNNNAFGVVSYENGRPGVFQEVFKAGGSSRWESDNKDWVEIPDIFDDGERFLLAIKTPDAVFTSRQRSNVDGLDHMVTYMVDNDPTHFLVAFEDLLHGGDQDFNDLVIEVRYLLDGPDIPEPMSAALLGFGLTGLAWMRRRQMARQ